MSRRKPSERDGVVAGLIIALVLAGGWYLFTTTNSSSNSTSSDSSSLKVHEETTGDAASVGAGSVLQPNGGNYTAPVPSHGGCGASQAQLLQGAACVNAQAIK